MNIFCLFKGHEWEKRNDGKVVFSEIMDEERDFNLVPIEYSQCKRCGKKKVNVGNKPGVIECLKEEKK